MARQMFSTPIPADLQAARFNLPLVDQYRARRNPGAVVLSQTAVILLVLGCTLQDYSYLENGVRHGDTSASGGSVDSTATAAGSPATDTGSGGANPASGGASPGSGGSTTAGLEPDPELPVLSCGATPCTDDAMICDMEANDGKVCAVEGRAGSLLYYGDGTGRSLPAIGGASKFSPLEACRGTSAVALHTKGIAFTSWGAGIAITFSAAGFDASRYTGILLWGRSSSSTQLSIAVATLGTQDVAYGGTCKPSGGKQCNDHFVAKRTLTPSWVAYPITFAELRQAGWGMIAPTPTVDTTTVIGLNIVAPQGQPYDYWLDDITFTM